MALDALEAQIPEFAKDLRLNLASLKRVSTLSPGQLWGSALAAAIAARNAPVIREMTGEAAAALDEAGMRGVRAAAAVMAMNNVYYRRVHLCSDESYSQLPARLRMQVIANPGVDRVDFEMWSLATSAVNGCGLCIDAHERALREAGVGTDAIQDVLRVAAIVHGVAVTLDSLAATAAA